MNIHRLNIMRLYFIVVLLVFTLVSPNNSHAESLNVPEYQKHKIEITSLNGIDNGVKNVIVSKNGLQLKTLTASDFSNSGLRGFNMGRRVPPMTDADFRDLADTKANIVRLVVHLFKCSTCSHFGLLKADAEYIDKVVAAGEKYGFYVLVAFAPQPAGEKASYWLDLDLQKSIVNTWVELAIKYKNSSIIAGYDLINEPVPPVSGGRHIWRVFSSQLVSEIRKVDANHVIVVEPGPWSGPDAFKNFLPLPFENIVYSLHFYEPMQITHQGIYEYKDDIAYPNSKWDIDWVMHRLNIVNNWSKKHRVPIYLGEFSIARWSPHGSQTRYLKDVIDYAEKAGWPWTYHGYREFDGWDSELSDDVSRGSKFSNKLRSWDAPAIKLLRQYFEKNTYKP